MLRKSCWLVADQVRVGKKVYSRGRPDRNGVICEVRRVPQLAHDVVEVKVFYSKSKRTTKWMTYIYNFCDLDMYCQEINGYYSQALICMRMADEAMATLEKRNGNKAKQIQPLAENSRHESQSVRD